MAVAGTIELPVPLLARAAAPDDPVGLGYGLVMNPVLAHFVRDFLPLLIGYGGEL